MPIVAAKHELVSRRYWICTGAGILSLVVFSLSGVASLKWSGQWRLSCVIKGHFPPRFCRPWSQDGTRIATVELLGAEDGPANASVWDARNGARICELAGHQSPIHSISLSPNGRYLLTVGHAEGAKLWDTRTSEEISIFRSEHLCGAEFSATGAFLLTAKSTYESHRGAGDVVAVWDAGSGRKLCERANAGAFVRAFFPDERLVCTSVFKQPEIEVWEATSGRLLGRLEVDTKWEARWAAISPDGQLIAASGFATGEVCVWEAETLQRTARLHHPRPVEDGVFIPDVNELVTLCEDNYIRVWDVGEGELEARLLDSRKPDRVDVSPKGEYVVSYVYPYEGKMWHSETLAQAGEMPGGPFFSPDGERMAAEHSWRRAKILVRKRTAHGGHHLKRPEVWMAGLSGLLTIGWLLWLARLLWRRHKCRPAARACP